MSILKEFGLICVFALYFFIFAGLFYEDWAPRCVMHMCKPVVDWPSGVAGHIPVAWPLY